MSITPLPPPNERVEKTSVEPEMTSLNHTGQQGKEAVLCSKSTVTKQLKKKILTLTADKSLSGSKFVDPRNEVG